MSILCLVISECVQQPEFLQGTVRLQPTLVEHPEADASAEMLGAKQKPRVTYSKHGNGTGWGSCLPANL